MSTLRSWLACHRARMLLAATLQYETSQADDQTPSHCMTALVLPGAQGENGQSASGHVLPGLTFFPEAVRL